jgi:hypothetical protein
MQSYLQKENRTLGTNFPGCSRPYPRASVGKKKKNTSEGCGGITFSNPAVVG